MAVKLASAFYLMRNQYKYRMRKLGQEIPDEDLQVIIGAQTDVEREVP